MKISFAFVSSILEPYITIHAPMKTPEILQLGQAIKDLTAPWQLIGYRGHETKLVSAFQISRLYTEDKRVVAELNSGERYIVHKPIYQLVQALPSPTFLQISSSELVRSGWIKKFKLTRAGMFQVIFKNDEISYASRRYTQRLRKDFLK
ncbi:LytTR family DNA-binding domain-containing protein [Furfurilactobacillus curtus]|uniref:Transcriptional regulator n=1 Tax=Furfurilactobacillus curtus TaxID=1746200 RepID=A0ABQ5JQ84_9LACO